MVHASRPVDHDLGAVVDADGTADGATRVATAVVEQAVEHRAILTDIKVAQLFRGKVSARVG